LAATGADYVALGHWDRATRVGDGTVPPTIPVHLISQAPSMSFD